MRDFMAIKLIAIDMDGTLLLPDHTISPRLKTRLPLRVKKG
ncbi:sugar phosphate phosphatase [Salmonella enterica subsp. enterica]|uniref:Sugar phosphate phosphatase n=1 Tax=Salmonella enterica I TaxID=59201 RepID=A0A379W1H2_SALET|nr:sugar phosphate phosphatase [Salmonella enterica subsp. enterica]